MGAVELIIPPPRLGVDEDGGWSLQPGFKPWSTVPVKLNYRRNKAKALGVADS